MYVFKYTGHAYSLQEIKKQVLTNYYQSCYTAQMTFNRLPSDKALSAKLQHFLRFHDKTSGKTIFHFQINRFPTFVAFFANEDSHMELKITETS